MSAELTSRPEGGAIPEMTRDGIKIRRHGGEDTHKADKCKERISGETQTIQTALNTYIQTDRQNESTKYRQRTA